MVPSSRDYQLARAISNEQRHRILEALQVQPMNISDLHRVTRLHRKTVSQHLNVLEKMGIVRHHYGPAKELQGRFGKYYYIDSNGFKEAVEAYQRVGEFKEE